MNNNPVRQIRWSGMHIKGNPVYEAFKLQGLEGV